MQLSTNDLWILENSFDYLEDLPKGDIWAVEFDDSEKVENFYFRSEKNAKNKFDELVKKHDLEVVNNSWWGRNSRWKSIWMWKLAFDD